MRPLGKFIKRYILLIIVAFGGGIAVADGGWLYRAAILLLLLGLVFRVEALHDKIGGYT